MPARARIAVTGLATTLRGLGLAAWLLPLGPLVGCATSGGAPQVESPLEGWSGPSPRMSLEVLGVAAEPDAIDQCARPFNEAGVYLDPGAAFKVRVTLNSDDRRLRVESPRRLIVDQPRSDKSLEAICREALQRAVAAWREEKAGDATGADGATVGVMTRADRTSAAAQSMEAPALGRAKAHHKSAKAHFEAGRYGAAIEDWVAAYEDDPRAQFLHNISNAYRKLGEKTRDVQSLRRAREYMVRYRDASPSPEIDAQIDALDKVIAQQSAAK